MSNSSDINTVPQLLTLLAHDVRWHILQILSAGDRRVQEIVKLVGKPQNLVSYHLKLLRDGQIVHERQSSQDKRDIYYSLNLDGLSLRYREVGLSLHPALLKPYDGTTRTSPVQTRVLFLCTHNSARSQLAEGFLRFHAPDSVVGFSAGSKVTAVHPQAVAAAADYGIDISHQYSKHFEDFQDETFDFVITVCDKAREICPTFPNSPQNIHWSLANPTAIQDPNEQAAAFEFTADQLSKRVQFFLASLAAE